MLCVVYHRLACALRIGAPSLLIPMRPAVCCTGNWFCYLGASASPLIQLQQKRLLPASVFVYTVDLRCLLNKNPVLGFFYGAVVSCDHSLQS